MAPTDSAAANDSFSVLLRYADATGEKLICKHAAQAAGIAERTAYTRISKAKASLNGEPNKSAGVEAFKILFQYAESSGSQLNVKAVSKATGLAERTVYTKVKQAREELEAKGGEQAGDSGKEEGALKSPTKKSPTKKSPAKKSPIKKAVKKEEEEEEAPTETDVVESPRQTRSGGVKRKNYAAMLGEDEDEVDDADVKKDGRGGKKTGKKVKTEDKDDEFEAGEGEETGKETAVEGGGDEKEVEKKAEKDETAVKDEET